MGRYLMVVVALIITMLSVSLGGSLVEATTHHVVGGDRGWALSSNIALWSSDKDFAVGDTIWFTYSASQDSITEVRSKEEFESCDLSNPIKMYTDGVDRVKLDGKGPRYFTSARPENCKNGLKLHIVVQSQSEIAMKKPVMVEGLAAGPTPSGAVSVQSESTLLFVGLLGMLYYMGV
ncbi:hypothetical protein GIB67_036021 [Kingdonia uniflora]|uniref:Phytocyanin domain-containing protein n=1 Tax=Kingdonia uniflora TaxID=39325 RepID=A0A7J7N1B4_9MAGN|nr:hypothetical protein GIB67_036021 [Kingdonia uniflora]